jgi:hypothetical protein
MGGGAVLCTLSSHLTSIYLLLALSWITSDMGTVYVPGSICACARTHCKLCKVVFASQCFVSVLGPALVVTRLKFNMRVQQEKLKIVNSLTIHMRQLIFKGTVSQD